MYADDVYYCEARTNCLVCSYSIECWTTDARPVGPVVSIEVHRLPTSWSFTTLAIFLQRTNFCKAGTRHYVSSKDSAEDKT